MSGENTCEIRPIAVRTTAGKGRGVFAAAAFDAGALIDANACVPLSNADCAAIENTPLGQYYFAHPQSAEDGLFLLGAISLVNHADAPNAEVSWRHESPLGWIAELRALRTIAPGEEITRRYVCPPWFEVVA